jgi:site-specific DNA-cytosine methylase
VVKRLTALGCYIFAGGFTLGVRKHFEVLTHFEEGPYGVDTAVHNELIKEAHIVPATWPIDRYKGQVDFVFANPPCAAWSVASHGRKTSWQDDPRINCTRRAYTLLDRLEPDVWAWESVRPAWTKGREFVESFARDAMTKGYSATVLLVNGLLHGVPQPRKRFFLVLHKHLIDWQPTGIAHKATVGEAILTKTKFKTETVVNVNVKEQRLFKHAKPGMSLRAVFDRRSAKEIALAAAEGRNVRGRPSFQRFRLRADGQSQTLTGMPHKIHPTLDRIISVEESAALCGYPRDFEFLGSTNKRYAQVAQAVMPPVGEYVARMVAASLSGRKRSSARPIYEQIEIFEDRIEREPLRLIGGSMSLALPPDVPPKERPMKKKVKGPSPFKAEVKNAKSPKTSRAVVRAARKGSGFRIRELLVKNVAPEKIVIMIRKEFPGSKATVADVSWNRRKLKLQGGKP